MSAPTKIFTYTVRTTQTTTHRLTLGCRNFFISTHSWTAIINTNMVTSTCTPRPVDQTAARHKAHRVCALGRVGQL